MLHYFFAPCPRGLESVLAAELEQLGAASVQGRDGGVQFRADWRICYRVNLESRIASRVLWQVASQPYGSEADIYDATRALPWNEWFSPGLTIRVNIAALKCPLRSLDFVKLRIKDAVCDKFREMAGRRPSVNTVVPDIRIHGCLGARKYSQRQDRAGATRVQR